MTGEINEDREFSENVDRLLEGEEVEVAEDATEDYRTAIQFAQKLREHVEEPSPAFKDGLRSRLLTGMAEAERRREDKASFWETLGNMVPRSPVWRSAADRSHKQICKYRRPCIARSTFQVLSGKVYSIS